MATHATENRLAARDAVTLAFQAGMARHAATGLYVAGVDAFLSTLREKDHVVGHVTDRHHELQARCVELLAIWDSAATMDDEAGSNAIEAIREVVANPMTGATP